MSYISWYKCRISVGTNVVYQLVQMSYISWYKCRISVGTNVVYQLVQMSDSSDANVLIPLVQTVYFYCSNGDSSNTNV